MSATKFSLGKQHDLLRDALKDVNAELSRLQMERRDLEDEIRRLTNTIKETQEEELHLKDGMRKMALKEKAVGMKREQLNKKILKLKQKIGKVQALGAKMSEVE
ncbi:MAG: hypothetical protein J4203_02740 [Candidatus Diapherotrites archaeon]|uniref:Uncharacterized protein n=1 Tax=Candidatus Iainarchaeum sp. TaxID=3101447 RepID=A0A8T4L819_9ARCH|nr:hypothetical protein [Candidatus Diapherotrites archaeon]